MPTVIPWQRTEELTSRCPECGVNVTAIERATIERQMRAHDAETGHNAPEVDPQQPVEPTNDEEDDAQP